MIVIQLTTKQTIIQNLNRFVAKLKFVFSFYFLSIFCHTQIVYNELVNLNKNFKKNFKIEC